MTSFQFVQNRFGLGVRGDDPSTAAAPARWLEQQFTAFRPEVAGIPRRAEVAGELADYLAEVRTGRADPARLAGAAMSQASMPTDQRQELRREARLAGRDTYIELVRARLVTALTTSTPFLERMTHFWANHFAVSANKLTTIGLAGLLEFEAIRPNVLGTFGGMLAAVERHPAMLLYLDQAVSIGPDSMIGQRVAARGANRGLNENLAREILELHTLGVRTGYSQADVTEFARAMTGRTVAGLGRGQMQRLVTGAPGDFAFVEQLHEPGERTILGKRYGQRGADQADAVLADLAVQPATARHIATKLARHFAADTPPPAMVARIERAFSDSRGDLPTVYRAVIASPEAWDPANVKFKTPWEWTVSALRGLGLKDLPAKAGPALLDQLGQPTWRPDSPAGFDDIAASWAGPDALVRRVEVAEQLAARAAPTLDARALAPVLLGDALSAPTAQAIARAESPATALALMLASPEFLRR